MRQSECCFISLWVPGSRGPRSALTPAPLAILSARKHALAWRVYCLGPSNHLQRILPDALRGSPPLAGCTSGVCVRETDKSPLFAAWKASAFTRMTCRRDLQTLRQLDFANLYHRSPREAYKPARTGPRSSAPRSPLCSRRGQFSPGPRPEKGDDCEAVAFYYLCAGYAYHFLFDGPNPGDTAFDPRFRLACDLYNNGLAKCMPRSAHRPT